MRLSWKACWSLCVQSCIHCLGRVQRCRHIKRDHGECWEPGWSAWKAWGCEHQSQKWCLIREDLEKLPRGQVPPTTCLVLWIPEVTLVAITLGLGLGVELETKYLMSCKWWLTVLRGMRNHVIWLAYNPSPDGSRSTGLGPGEFKIQDLGYYRVSRRSGDPFPPTYCFNTFVRYSGSCFVYVG